MLSKNAGWFIRLSQAKPNSQQRSAKGGVYTSFAAQAAELDDVAVNAALKWWNLQVVGATSDLASCIMEAMPSTLMADTKSGGFICIKNNRATFALLVSGCICNPTCSMHRCDAGAQRGYGPKRMEAMQFGCPGIHRLLG